jgi:hypothetical protein
MKYLASLILLFSVASSFGQTKYIVRVHAFSQEIIPGVAPAVGDGEVYKPKKHCDYQVFIECKPTVEMKLNTIRLNGKLHEATVESVQSPVVQFHSTLMRNDTLIQKTLNKILKVVLGKELASSSSVRDSVGVALSYSVRGKKYSFGVKKFKELPPIAMP